MIFLTGKDYKDRFLFALRWDDVSAVWIGDDDPSEVFILFRSGYAKIDKYSEKADATKVVECFNEYLKAQP